MTAARARPGDRPAEAPRWEALGRFKTPAGSQVARAEGRRGGRAGGALEEERKSPATQPTGSSVDFTLNVTESH